MLLSRSYVYGLYQLLCCIVVEGSYNLHIMLFFGYHVAERFLHSSAKSTSGLRFYQREFVILVTCLRTCGIYVLYHVQFLGRPGSHSTSTSP